jgi:hypothetical protein
VVVGAVWDLALQCQQRNGTQSQSNAQRGRATL